MGAGPLLLPSETTDSVSLRSEYWSRVVHVDQAGASPSEADLRLTAFSYLGIPPNNEALAPSARLDAGTRIEVERRACDAGACISWSHAGFVAPDALRVMGDTVVLRAELDGCEIDVSWRVDPDATMRSPDLVPGVVPPWYGEDGFWPARAEGRACGVPIDAASSAVG